MEKVSRLGRMLLEAKLITEEQLKMATDFKTAVGGKLAAIIVKLGFIEEHTLTNFMAKAQGLRVVNLDEIVIPQNLIKRIPRKVIETHHVIPISYKNGVLGVATADPTDYEAMEELQLAQDARIEIHLAPRSQILRTVSHLFPSDEAEPRREKGAERKGGGPAPAPASPAPVSKAMLQEALIPLLLEKGIITEDELARKAREIDTAAEKEQV